MKSTFANKEFPPSRRTRRSAGRWSDALKEPRIRRAVSTLVYATPLHPAQRHLPVNLHPPNSAPFFGQVGWQVHAGGGHAGADSTVKMTTHEAALGPSRTRPPSGLPPPSCSWRCPSTPPRPTSWWQQQRLFGGPHAKSWPALPLHQVTSPFAPAWSIHGT